MKKTTDTKRQQNDDEADQAEAVRCLKTQIRALLPETKRLVEAFGELHKLLAEHDQVADFDAWCQREFGVVPELLLDATERLSLPRKHDHTLPPA